MKRIFLLLVVTFAVGVFAQGGYSIADLSTPQVCWSVLKSDAGEVLRRKAYKKLLYSPETFDAAVEFGLKDRDSQIRRITLYELFAKDKKRALPVMQQFAVAEEAPDVLIMLIELSSALDDKAAAQAMVEKVFARTKLPEVRKMASRSMGFNFFKDVKLYSSNPANDHEVVCIKAIELPSDGWLFKTDEGETGHRGKNPFFKEKIDEAGWRPSSIGLSWEKQGVVYDGIAWYRLKLDLPEMPEGAQAAELHFLGVDECAWVWVNGSYIGQHNLGLRGWNIPFKLDCTKELRWGQGNTIVVRVEDTQLGGGIYKGIALEVLK